MAERDLIERLDDAIEAILADRNAGLAGLALSEPELATLLVVADDLRELPDPNFRSKLKAELFPSTEDEMTTMTAEAPKTVFHTITPYLLVGGADGHTMTPFLHALGARALITFLENAFGANVQHVTEMAGREVAHAGVRIGDSMIELGEAHGEAQPTPASIHLYVPDVDATYERAVRAGATSVNPPENKPYGERGAFVIDPFGNQWFIATMK